MSATALNEQKDGKDRLIIFDTTLRDGEQSPGATLTMSEKVQIAKQLSLMGVDVCEAGFPIASPGDFEAVKKIAQEIGPMEDNREFGPMTICGLSRAHPKDIQRCFDAVKHAPRHRIHTFLATSDIHLKYKLKISRDECIANAVKAVKFASGLTDNVEFSPEDAGRSDRDFLVEVLDEVVNAGAKTLNIPDTVGYTTPEEYGSLIKYLVDNMKNADKAIFSTHCHNDLGLATANTLNAVVNGARQVEVTINGIGERAGNTSLEEVAMAIRTRPNNFPVWTSLETTLIMRTSRMVSAYTGMMVQPNKAIVGANAFAHEAGIHQDGVLKHQETYEIMKPESVGLSANLLVLGKHSGRHAYSKRLEELGYKDLPAEKLDELVQKFKKLADEKKVVTDADMEAIIADETYKPEDAVWKLKSVHVTAGNLLKPTATVSLVHSGTNAEMTNAAIGTGPVDAVYAAISSMVKVPNDLSEFSVNSVTDGIDALGHVTVKVESRTEHGETETTVNPQTGERHNVAYSGSGANTDIIVASAQAYLNALNRMIAHNTMNMKRSDSKTAGI